MCKGNITKRSPIRDVHRSTSCNGHGRPSYKPFSLAYHCIYFLLNIFVTRVNLICQSFGKFLMPIIYLSMLHINSTSTLAFTNGQHFSNFGDFVNHPARIVKPRTYDSRSYNTLKIPLHFSGPWVFFLLSLL